MSVPVAETIKLAAESVWVNRFRSGLTILGIVIGITTVVTVISVIPSFIAARLKPVSAMSHAG